MTGKLLKNADHANFLLNGKTAPKGPRKEYYMRKFSKLLNFEINFWNISDECAHYPKLNVPTHINNPPHHMYHKIPVHVIHH